MHPKTKTMQCLTLDIIRHGEPQGGVLYRGSKDDPLSERGWEQLQTATDNMLDDGTSWTHIVSSPMLRCQEFAKTLSERLSLDLTIENDLRELCFGDLEGMRPEEAWTQYPELLTNLWQAPEQHTPPNGEPFLQFTARVGQALKQILNRHHEGHVLVVAHGGVIRAALNTFLNITPGDSFKIDVPYASVSRFKAFRDNTTDTETVNLSLSFINKYQG